MVATDVAAQGLVAVEAQFADEFVRMAPTAGEIVLGIGALRSPRRPLRKPRKSCSRNPFLLQ